MYRKQATPFLTTPRGRKVVFSLTAAATVIASSAKLLPETIFINKYIDVFHSYRNGKQDELSEKLANRFNKCIEILDPPQIHKKVLRAFTVCGFEIFYAGSTKSSKGAVVGIPINYNYESVRDIDKANILINHRSVRWDSTQGRIFQDSLILPEKVQLFAICREIIFMQNWKLHIDSVYPALVIIIIYGINSALNQKLNLFEIPRVMRMTMYLITCCFGLGLYFFLKDFTQIHFEKKTDKKLCQLGPDFIESGIEYYDKILKRNMALRHLMGEEGRKKFTTLGNENYYFRQPRIPIVQRKLFFEEQLKEYKRREASGESHEKEKLSLTKLFSFKLDKE